MKLQNETVESGNATAGLRGAVHFEMWRSASPPLEVWLTDGAVERYVVTMDTSGVVLCPEEAAERRTTGLTCGLSQLFTQADVGELQQLLPLLAFSFSVPAASCKSKRVNERTTRAAAG